MATTAERPTLVGPRASPVPPPRSSRAGGRTTDRARRRVARRVARRGGHRAAPRRRKRLGRVVDALGWALFATAGVLLLALGIGPHVLGYRTVTMLSGSMSPRYPTGAVLVVRAEPTAELAPGQVLTYQIPVGDHHVESHRVVSVTVDAQGAWLVRTKGDANNAADPWVARITSPTVWVVRGGVPGLGWVLRALRQPPVRLAMLYGLPGALLVWVLVGIWRPPPPKRVRRTA